MTSFKSKHYPASSNSLMVIQDIAMRYYAVLALIVMAAVMVKISIGQSPLWVGVLGFIGAIIMGNAIAYVQLRKQYAQIFFVKQHFSLISVYEILYKKENNAFPLRYANPTRSEDQINLHFNDQIITLDRDDWEDFDLIWEWLIAGATGLIE